MTDGRALSLRRGSVEFELLAQREELGLTLAHTYHAFLPEGGHLPLPELEEAGEVPEWQAALDGEDVHFSSFTGAVQGLVDRVADRLLEGLSGALLLHAAVVTDDVHTILLVGPSGAGKTTLALELVSRGLRYATDEFAIVRDRELLPFPRSAVRKQDGPRPAGRNLQIPYGEGYLSFLLPELRCGLEARPLGSTWILFPSRGRQGPPSSTFIGAAECCARLMPSVFGLRGQEQELWPVIAQLAARSRAHVLEYESWSQGADLVQHLLSTKEE